MVFDCSECLFIMSLPISERMDDVVSLVFREKFLIFTFEGLQNLLSIVSTGVISIRHKEDSCQFIVLFSINQNVQALLQSHSNVGRTCCLQILNDYFVGLFYCRCHRREIGDDLSRTVEGYK